LSNFLVKCMRPKKCTSNNWKPKNRKMKEGLQWHHCQKVH
uniref:Ovule protein n=1 Tax=Brugia timori TaxID=42155 RepID=A0A0R3Q8H2_9BILA